MRPRAYTRALRLTIDPAEVVPQTRSEDEEHAEDAPHASCPPWGSVKTPLTLKQRSKRYSKDMQLNVLRGQEHRSPCPDEGHPVLEHRRPVSANLASDFVLTSDRQLLERRQQVSVQYPF